MELRLARRYTRSGFEIAQNKDWRIVGRHLESVQDEVFQSCDPEEVSRR